MWVISNRSRQAICWRISSEPNYSESMSEIPTTDYFRYDVLMKRPYIKRVWCQSALLNPVRREIQDEGESGIGYLCLS
jgi:hypothetical protein